MLEDIKNDGDIRFRAAIDIQTRNVRQVFAKVLSAWKKTGKDIEDSAADTYRAVERESHNATESMLRDYTAQNKSVKQLSKAIGDVSREIGNLNNIREQLLSAEDVTELTDSFGNVYDSTIEGIEKIETTMGELGQVLDQLGYEWDKAFAADAAEMSLSRKKAKVEELTARYQELLRIQEELSRRPLATITDSAGQSWSSGNLEALKNTIANLKFQIDTINNTMPETQQQTNKTAKHFNKLRVAIIGVLRVSRNLLGRGLSRLSGLLPRLSKHAANTGLSFKKLTGAMLAAGLGIKSISALFNKIKAAALDGVKSLALVDAETNQSISNIMTSLNELKGSFGAAFAPILNVVAPIITKFVSLLTTATNAVGMFIARLTGQSTYKKAVAVQQDYAGSLNDTADAANNANNATQEYLSGLDEIKKWDDTNTAGAGGGGGAGGGAGDDALTWEEVEIPDSIKNFADTLKGFFEESDWEGLGEFIADKINSVFEKVYEIVNWDNVGPKITPVIEGITTTFNSLVDNVDWDLIGRTFGAGVNTIVNTANLLLTGVDWTNLGSKIAEGLRGFTTEVNWTNVGTTVANGFNAIIDAANGFVTKMSQINLTSGLSGWQEAGKSIADTVNGLFSGIKWDTLGQTISEGVKGALSTLSTAIQNINWKQMGEDIKTLLVNIDWAGIADALFEAIGSIIGGIGAFLIGLFKDAIDALANWWNTNAFDENGKFTGEGLLNAIGDVFKNIGKWIKEHIFQPFIDGFKKVFGISSPATAPELVEVAGYVGKGILEAIANVFKNIGDWVKTNILDKITAAIEKVGLTIKAGVQLVRDGWTKVSTWIENSYLGQSVKKLIELGRDGWGSVANWINEFHLGKEVKKLIGLGRDGWGSVANWISNSYMGKAVKKLIGLSRDGWSTVRNWIAGTWMGKALSKSIGLARDGWSTVRNWIAASWMGKVLLKGVDLFRNWVRAGVSTVADWVRQFIGGSVSVGVGLRFEGGTGSHAFASGGTISANGTIVDWNSIPKYAGGTTNAHGTLFVAGEHGPEIMGHIGGRTEILNKSQLAETMYAAIVNGFATILQQFSTALFSHLNYDTNAIINTLTNRITLSNMQIPAIARGSAIPNNTQFLSAVSGGGVISGTSEQALRQIIREESQNRNYEFIAQINRRTLFDEFIQEAKLRQMQTGQNPFEFA